MKRPGEHEYHSFVRYARDLEKYCDWLEATLEQQTARIVDLQTHIENLEGEQ